MALLAWGDKPERSMIFKCPREDVRRHGVAHRPAHHEHATVLTAQLGLDNNNNT